MEEHVFGFEKLEVWNLARHFTMDIYNIIKAFPPEEKFGLISQLTRAALSISCNIAEGSGRKTKKDKAHFYRIAYSSLLETISLLIVSRDLGFIDKDQYDIMRKKILEISNKLNALYKSQLDNSTT